MKPDQPTTGLKEALDSHARKRLSDFAVSDLASAYHGYPHPMQTLAGDVRNLIANLPTEAGHEAEMVAFGASDAACYYYPGEDQLKERAAFCDGAAHAAKAGAGK